MISPSLSRSPGLSITKRSAPALTHLFRASYRFRVSVMATKTQPSPSGIEWFDLHDMPAQKAHTNSTNITLTFCINVLHRLIVNGCVLSPMFENKRRYNTIQPKNHQKLITSDNNDN